MNEKLVECPVCNGVGQIWVRELVDGAFEVRTFSEGPFETPVKEDDYWRCKFCNGYGQVYVRLMPLDEENNNE